MQFEVCMCVVKDPGSANLLFDKIVAENRMKMNEMGPGGPGFCMGGRGYCTVRSNASWVMVTSDCSCEQVDTCE